MEITPELLAHIESLAVRATPSPWIFRERDTELHSCDARLICSCHAKPRNPVDIDYIQATSPALVLSLINKILCLEKEADWLADEISYLDSQLASDRGRFNNELISPNEWREAARKAVEENR